jgi:hypothetical protein
LIGAVGAIENERDHKMPEGTKKKKLRVATIAAVAVIAACAVAGVVYGLATREPVELMRVCWEGERARPLSSVEGANGPSSCPNPVELRWAKSAGRVLEVRAGSVRTELSRMDERVLNTAVRTANALLGERFVMVQSGGQVFVGFDHPSGPNVPVADVVFHRDGDDDFVGRAEVRVRHEPDPEDLHMILLHELGHVLGLQHNRSESSVMHWSMGRRAWGEPLMAPRFSDGEVDLVRATWR